jgi:putative NADH-flavin reductase
MHIALVGATGQIGRRIARTALDRGHAVTAVVRSDAHLPAELAGARVVVADLDDRDALAAAVRGHDALASAYGPAPDVAADTVVAVARTLVAVAGTAGVRRLVVVGGAGSLEIAPGLQLVDTPDFPAAYKPVALAHRSALDVYRGSDLDWTFFAPAAEIGPGDTRGTFRTGAVAFLRDAHGASRIGYGDYAAAFVDELETPRFVRQVATVAY